MTERDDLTASGTQAADKRADNKNTLDPEDWDDFRAHAHAHLDRLLNHVQGIESGPVWQVMPDTIRQQLAEPPPKLGQGLHHVLDDFNQLILPYGTGNTHPRFFGWVHGAGTPTGILAEAAAAALNSNCGGRDHGAIQVERAVIDWFCQIFGLGPKAGGLLVTGTSIANLLAVVIARNSMAPQDIRAIGCGALPLVAYTSVQAHSCLTKAFEILGLGRENLRLIPVDENFSMDCAALEAAVLHDRSVGNIPFMVAGTAGTVNSGAFDDLTAIAALCKTHKLWFHVDGAFGALAILSPRLRSLVAGIELADSLAFDMHKWLHVPYDAGCILVRDQALQVQAFGGRPDYLTTGKGLSGGNLWPADLGVDLSRSFRALKVWFTVKEHGFDALGDAIADNCRLARYFADKLTIPNHNTLKLMAPVSLNIVCCRLEPANVAEPQLDQLNSDVVAQLQIQGIAAPSTCRIDGKVCIRICIVNHRTQERDMDILFDAILEEGKRWGE